MVDDGDVAHASRRILVLEAAAREHHVQLAFKETGDLELAAIGGGRVIRAEQAGAGDLGDRNAGLQPGVEIIRVDGGEVLLFLLLVAGEQAQVKLRLTNAIGDAVDKPGLVVCAPYSRWCEPFPRV